MKVLLLSAYAAQSHVYWRRTLQEMFPDWQWRILEMPPRYFSWRVRGNPLYWALQQRSTLEGDYDLLLVTSMVDLATLRGLVPPLVRLPAVLYFHENQFAYPPGRLRHGLLEAQMVSLYAALAADRVVFNSAYNRDTFLEGCSALLDKLPDYTPAVSVPLLREKARVLPVPLSLSEPQRVEPHWPGTPGEYPARPLRLLWSGRFEHDKGGEGLYAVLQRLELSGLDYELALSGQQFRDAPPVFERIVREWEPRLVHCGYLASRSDYLALLRAADIALSTALHEFQGLSMLEAVGAGCLPVVPDRLAYAEIYPQRFRYLSSPGDESEAKAAADRVIELAARLARRTVTMPDVSVFDCAPLRSRYLELFTELAG